MSKTLSKMLSKPEEEIGKMIYELERLCGYPSEDVRLVAQNKQALRSKLDSLNLDPDDTTDEELYHALQSRFESDSNAIDQANDIDQNSTFREKLSVAMKLVSRAVNADDVWVIKKSAVKTILDKHPPKHVAKILNYRSYSSMVKRRDVTEIVLASNVLESDSWQASFNKLIAKLTMASYEKRPIRVIKIDSRLASASDTPASHVMVDARVGAMGLWPSEQFDSASVLIIALAVIQASQTLNPDHYGEVLGKLSPQLRWWADSEHLITDGQNPMSFNINDVSHNVLNHHTVEKAVSDHGAEALWRELASRYRRITESVENIIDGNDSNKKNDFQLPKMPLSSELAAELAAIE